MVQTQAPGSSTYTLKPSNVLLGRCGKSMLWALRENQFPSLQIPQVLFLLSFLDSHREVEMRILWGFRTFPAPLYS